MLVLDLIPTGRTPANGFPLLSFSFLIRGKKKLNRSPLCLTEIL